MSFFSDVHRCTVDTIDLTDEENRLIRGAYYVVGFPLWVLIILVDRISDSLDSDSLPDDHAFREYGYDTWDEVYRYHYGEEQ